MAELLKESFGLCIIAFTMRRLDLNSGSENGEKVNDFEKYFGDTIGSTW